MSKPTILPTDEENTFSVTWAGASKKLTVKLSGANVAFAVDGQFLRLQIIETRLSVAESGWENRSESKLEDDSYHCPELVSIIRGKPKKIKIKKQYDEPGLLSLTFKSKLSLLSGSVHNTSVTKTDGLEIEWVVLPHSRISIARYIYIST